ncbi:MAG: efflux RND transporter periplasmic adaptor subunit [Xanthomonadaceae bacterium]|nr:efflux RND transporter periplasmic adaptor subunit [Xanthomonadaceae bacterium]MDE1885964.1 efflux RND transporter periplasmic adaptor subunit [Xanthomonadaceae bacterium]MDE1960561.1 efflux RND transporter periplasmic adaptor subunit [Xanthomonadaceae bacterium]MDE2083330.1 efflux RND transporter periplasmic adaptor subunit [Xanthomonadaceae bacterium]
MSDSLTATHGNGNGKRRRLLLSIAAIFVVAGMLWLTLWWFVFSLREVTDDAYVNGNQVIVSSQVPGTVTEILTDDTQRVDAGQVLVKLDPTDADLALAKAQSALAQAVRQVRQQTQMAGQYDAAIAAQRENLARAQADLKRREPLLAEHAVAPEEVAHVRQAVADAQAALDAAQRQSAAAHALVDGTSIASNPLVQQARAAFREAWVNAHRNAIVAPTSGYVAQRSVQVGSRVQPGQPLLTIVPLHDLWVDANFKESQLTHIRIGQPAQVHADVYGGDVTFDGRVEGLAAGTGGAFALLPAQNASGNWIKVVQRVPVRVLLDPKQLTQHPLRIGLSTEVTVDTHDRNGAVLAQQPSAKAVAQTSVYGADLGAADVAADAIVKANLAH